MRRPTSIDGFEGLLLLLWALYVLFLWWAGVLR